MLGIPYVIMHLFRTHWMVLWGTNHDAAFRRYQEWLLVRYSKHIWNGDKRREVNASRKPAIAAVDMMHRCQREEARCERDQRRRTMGAKVAANDKHMPYHVRLYLKHCDIAGLKRYIILKVRQCAPRVINKIFQRLEHWLWNNALLKLCVFRIRH